MAPAAARVELADQIQQPRGGGIEMRGELGDLVTETLQLDDVWMSRHEAGSIDVHRRISLRRLYTAIFEPSRRHQDARSRAGPEFFGERVVASRSAPTRDADAGYSS